MTIDPSRLAVHFRPTGNRGRVVGMPVLARNRRAVLRAGALLADSETPPVDASHILLADDRFVLQPELLINLPELSHPAKIGPWEFGPVAAIHSDRPENQQPTNLDVDPRRLLKADTPSDRKHAGRALLAQSAKSTDGPVSRRINRPMSRLFSALFLQLGLQPWHASVIGLLIGLAAAWCAAQPGWLWLALAGFWFQIASMWDGVDGEMARVTFSESAAGAMIDTLIDNVTYAACLAGLLIGWHREGFSTADMALATGLLLVLPPIVWLVARFVRKHARDASLVIVAASVVHAARSSTAVTLRFAGALFPIFRRDVAAFVLMILCLSGSRVLILAMLFLGLLLALYTLLFHQAALGRAAAELGQT